MAKSKVSKTKLIIHSPRQWQVFQRSAKRRGQVVVSGQVTGPADSVQVQLTGESTSGKLTGEWQNIPLDRATGAFNKSLTTPAGGWYAMAIRARAGSKTVATAAVKKLGVGEVFVTAGQSNSTSCGQFATKQTSGMVSAFNGKAWRRATDPMWGAHDLIEVDDVFKGGSPWLAFGDQLAEYYGVPIGMAVTGHGGSSVNQWQPGCDLYEWMITRVHQLGVMGFRAMLWHQGESDIEIPEKYAGLLTTVIESTKHEAGWNFPWFVAKTTYHNPATPCFPKLQQAFDDVWASGVALPGPDTDTLTGKNRDFDGEGIHFSRIGLRAHGRMWADMMANWLGKP